MNTEELVMVVPTEKLAAVGLPHGFSADAGKYAAVLDNIASWWFRPRRLMENDPTHKQIIPYGVLRCGDRFFHYRRAPESSEGRLRGLCSVGVGGHVNPEDIIPGLSPHHGSLVRELGEELIIDRPYSIAMGGVINDDTTDVGKVHFGVVFMVTLSDEGVRIRDAALDRSGFDSAAALHRDRALFEPWSQFVLDHLIQEG